MAEKEKDNANPLVNFTISEQAINYIVNLQKASYSLSKNTHDELLVKMRVTDILCARYSYWLGKGNTDFPAGIDIESAIRAQAEANALEDYNYAKNKIHNLQMPIMASQVETAVGYLADTFLSGSPMFPVVADPAHAELARYIETLTDVYSRISDYPGELMLFFRDAVKYNYAPIQCRWDMIQDWTPKVETTTDPSLNVDIVSSWMGYNRISRLDPYNTYVPPSTRISNVNKEGDFLLTIDMKTNVQLRTLMKRLKKLNRGKLMNTKKIKNLTTYNSARYNERPRISEYIGSRPLQDTDWDAVLAAGCGQRSLSERGMKKGNMFEVTHFYFRATPNEVGQAKLVTEDERDDVRSYYAVIVNNEYLLYLESLHTPYNVFNATVCQPFEDGFGLATRSLAESVEPLQTAISTLLNARLHGSRRAMTDRALFNPQLVRASDVNSPSPTAKIPIRTSSMTNLSDLRQAYMPIPYDNNATNGLFQDMSILQGAANDLTGNNRVVQGQFQKGNKTREEFSTTMSNAEMRQRLPAVAIEYQALQPIKAIMKFNIATEATNSRLIDPTDGRPLDVDKEAIRTALFSFKLADGVHPANQIAGTQALDSGFRTIQQNQMLSAMVGPKLVNLFKYLMQQAGARGIDQFLPTSDEVNQYYEQYMAQQQAAAKAGNQGQQGQQGQQGEQQ